MTQVTDTTAPMLLQPARVAHGTNFSEREFTGFLAWIDRPWVFRIVLGFVALTYLASITPNWYPTSDSALYLMLGDNLASGQGYTLWGKPHTHVPPGFPLLLAGLKLVGIESYLGLNTVMALLACATLFCCYHALRELVSPTLAKWLVCLVAVSHTMQLTSVCLLSDIPFMAVVWLGLWCQLHGLRTRSWTLEVGSMLLLASCGIRVLGITIAIGASVGLLLQTTPVTRKRIWANAGVTLASLLLVLGAAIIFVVFKSKNGLSPNYVESFFKFVEQAKNSGFTKPFWNALNTGPELSSLLTGQKNGFAGYFVNLFWIPILAGALVCWRRRAFIPVCLLAIYLLSLLLLRPLLARYLLPLSPLIFWFFLEGVLWLSERIPAVRVPGMKVVGMGLILLLAFHVPKACKLAYRLHYPKSDNVYAQQQALQTTASFLQQSVKPGELFITNHDERLLAYLSGIWTIPSAEREFAKGAPTEEMLLKHINDHVRFIVVREHGRYRHTKRFRSIVANFRESRLVFNGGGTQVYQLISKPASKKSLRTACIQELHERHFFRRQL